MGGWKWGDGLKLLLFPSFHFLARSLSQFTGAEWRNETISDKKIFRRQDF
jgi:hypothetical protein